MRERNKLFHNCEHHQTRRTNATSHEVICKHSCKKTKFPVSVFYDGPCCKWVLKCHGCQSQPCDMVHIKNLETPALKRPQIKLLYMCQDYGAGVAIWHRSVLTGCSKQLPHCRILSASLQNTHYKLPEAKGLCCRILYRQYWWSVF